ncbi:MAG: HAMP domain-containing sensor histidine kinase [Bacteroidota bacterium]
MVKNYNKLIGTILVCLVGMGLLQAYFAVNDLQVKVFQLDKEFNELFVEAVEKERKIREDAYIDYYKSLMADTNFITIDARYDEEKQAAVYSIKDTTVKEGYSVSIFDNDTITAIELKEMSYEEKIDKLTKIARSQIEEGAIFYWTQIMGELLIDYSKNQLIDTVALDSILGDLMTQDNIHTSYEIVTFHKDSFNLDTLKQKYEIRTQTLTLDFELRGADREAIAIIPNAFPELLERISLTLYGSIIIILLIAVTFFAMLRIIFKQKQLAQIKDDFIDNITHELQTPIATLMAANEGMQKYQVLKDEEKTKIYLKISNNELERLSKMVDNILLSSINDSKELGLRLEQINIDELLIPLEKKYKLKTKKPLYINISYSDPIKQFMTDAFHFRNIMDNLIENAIKYNEAELVKIDINFKKDQDQLKITVTDNGIGIAPENREKVFEKFFRIPNKDGIAIKGYGIGLYYVKNIIHQLNGQIHIGDRQEAGTQFIISLPLNHEV